MGGNVCPKCGVARAPREDCPRCGLVYSKFASTPLRLGSASAAKRRHWRGIAAGVFAALATAVVALVLAGRRRPDLPLSAPTAPPAAVPAAPLSLAGIWSGTVRKTIPGPPVREAVKTVTIEADAAGDITAASVIYRDPSSEAVGAGYRIVPDGDRRLGAILDAFDSRGIVRAFVPDFLPTAKELRPAAADWNAIEGYWARPPRDRRAGKARRREDISYVLLESTEPEMLCQVGIRKTGFLSYASFDRAAYLPAGRGQDQISSIIDPPENSVLGSFSHLVWDLSGSTDFLRMRIEATVTGPGGGPDALYLMK